MPGAPATSQTHGSVQRAVSAAPPVYRPAPAWRAPGKVAQPFLFRYGKSTIDTESYTQGTFDEDTEQNMLSYLRDKVLPSGFDPDTGEDLTSAEKKQIRGFISFLKPTKPSARTTFGYSNPTHNSEVGLELLEEGAHTPYDPNRWSDKEEWLMSPNRNFETYSPNSRTKDTGFTKNHTNVVFGHDEGASEHWNRVGHTQTKQENKDWNQEKDTFHGLETRTKSNKSGGSAPRYNAPSQKVGSHPMFWQPTHQDFEKNFSHFFK